MKIVQVYFKPRGKEVPAVERDGVLYQMDDKSNWRTLRQTVNKKKEEWTTDKKVAWGSDLEKELYHFIHQEKWVHHDPTNFDPYSYPPVSLATVLDYVLGWAPTKKKRLAVKTLQHVLNAAQEYESKHGDWGNQVYIRAVMLEIGKLIHEYEAEDPWE